MLLDQIDVVCIELVTLHWVHNGGRIVSAIRRRRADRAGRGVADFKQGAGCGPDPDAGHGGQGSGERVCIECPFYLCGDVSVARAQFQTSARLG